MKKENNVILFPKTLETLETKSFAAIDEQDFKTGLEKLNILLAHQVFSYEINVGKLICLIKLQRLEEAEQFCENLLTEREAEHYYDYVEYFIMILYEKGKYNEVMDTINEENEIGQVPSAAQEKFAQLYEICYQINEITANELTNDLKRAIKEHNAEKQWYVINKWQQLHIRPPKVFSDFLKNEDVHPVVKTKILEALHEYKVDEHVEVEKFGRRITVRPIALLEMDMHPIYEKTLTNIQLIEHDNPTLFQLVKELYDQYSYVHYPFVYPESDVGFVAQALIQLGKVNLSLPQTVQRKCVKTNKYMKEIQKSHELYLKIMLQ